ncbi:hypothetical protein ES703_09347 [subsurface metagenome]
MMICFMPEATASSTTCWIMGLSARGSISLGMALVAGRNLVPQPPAGITALRISITLSFYMKPSLIGKVSRRLDNELCVS